MAADLDTKTEERKLAIPAVEIGLHGYYLAGKNAGVPF